LIEADMSEIITSRHGRRNRRRPTGLALMLLAAVILGVVSLGLQPQTAATAERSNVQPRKSDAFTERSNAQSETSAAFTGRWVDGKPVYRLPTVEVTARRALDADR
jgi:hypothetical protein